MKMTGYSNHLIHGFFSLSMMIICACSSDEGADNSTLTASAGNSLNVPVGEVVTLDGSGSTNSQGNPFEFSWKFIVKPPGSVAQLQNSTSEKPSFTPDVQGKYKIELAISNTSKSLDTVNISAYKVITLLGNYENLFPGPNVGIRDFVLAFGELYATCEFTKIGGIDAKKIARYNGSVWNTVGCGLAEGSIYDMMVYKGELYVTGDFDEIGCIPAKNIARWNGSAWKDVEGGLTGGNESYGFTLSVYKDELYVAGLFTKAGGVNASNIAKWDGTKWSAVGTIENGSVRELLVYKEKLYAGGFFTAVNGINAKYIASYDGTSWTALGSLNELELKGTGVVLDMAVFKDVLYISGQFSSNNQAMSELITWNGTQFQDFGRAFTYYQGNNIRELKVINDILYIGGNFKNVVGSQANNILQWDGESWGIMSEGIGGSINSIELFNNKIFIGGDFDKAGGKEAANISIWTKN